MPSDLLILLAAEFIPMGVLIGLVSLVSRWQARRQLRVPVGEKLLRAPGESLRRKLEDLDEQITLEVVGAFFLPSLFVSLILAQQHTNFPLGAVALSFNGAVGLIAFGLLCRRILGFRSQRVRLRLGLSGERAVGEELNLLMLEGARVFHDVPNAPYGNIDHVLIATTGVFAVETKTRRKRPPSKGGEPAHRVIYDGQSLRYPDCQGVKPLEQARQQASRLSDFLSKAVGEPVAVRPVLALPGWFVERTGQGEVVVLSGKALKVLARGRAVLPGAMIERIAHQLDQRCRDVEF